MPTSFVQQMIEKIRTEYQCNESDIKVSGLNLGTTWEAGQDYQASYEVSYEDGRHYEGQIFWSSVSQQVYF